MPETPDGGYILDDAVRKYDFSFCRNCKHFHGMDKDTCDAFPNGVPDKFSSYHYGESPRIHVHKTPERGQIGEFVFASVFE